MLEFFSNNWKDIIEILISLIVGFIGGKTYTNYINKKIRQTSKIKGNNNTVNQKGE